MYTVSNEFKEVVQSNAVIATARITLVADGTVLDGNNLSSVSIKDYCNNNGTIIGTTMCKEVEIELINNEYDLADQEFLLELGVEIAEDTIEYIPYGNFLIKEYQDVKSSNRYKIVAYDYMDKLNAKFIDNNEYPITLQQFYTNLASDYGLEIEEQELPNQNFNIETKPYFDGATGRNVLSSIAQMFGSFAKINRNNKIQMYLKTETSEQISREQMNSSLEINKIYGPINSVVLSLSNVEGENVSMRDEPSIEANGETTLEIQDNPFIYTEALRSQALEGIFNRVFGFSYIPTSFNYKAYLYLDCGDAVQVQQMSTDEYVDTIILNQEIKVPATRKSKCENLALTKTQVNNQYVPPEVQAQRRTEIIVNKQEGTIQQIAEKTEQNATSILQVTQQSNELIIQAQELRNEMAEVEGNLENISKMIEDMTFNFGTDGLRIATSQDANNSILDNTGIRLYNYEDLQAIFNYKGSGVDKLIVTGPAQIGYLKIVKSTKDNKKVTKLFHLDQLIENLTDLEV